MGKMWNMKVAMALTLVIGLALSAQGQDVEHEGCNGSDTCNWTCSLCTRASTMGRESRLFRRKPRTSNPKFDARGLHWWWVQKDQGLVSAWGQVQPMLVQ